MDQAVKSSQQDKKKLLIGVFHAYKDKRTCNEEIKMILDLIQEHRPKTMAIELPYDYETREKHGLRVFFFGDLAAQAKVYGISVQPMEEPAEWDRRHALDVARNISSGRINVTEVKERVKELNRAADADGERTTANNLIRERYENGIRLLKGNGYASPARIERRIDESNRKREGHMLSMITSTNPDFVVVGASHAFKLNEQLRHYLFINALREAEQSSKRIPESA